MTRKCSVFIATSLDGFIAKEDGSVDWLLELHASAAPNEDFGYKSFIETVDALVMGRKSFEQALTAPQWYYGETPVVVLSRTLTLPRNAPKTVTISSSTPEQVVADLASQGKQHLYIDGGEVIQSFLGADLIDELTITVIPILLRAGIRLFGPRIRETHLLHKHTESFPSGFVQSKYAIDRRAPLLALPSSEQRKWTLPVQSAATLR